MWEILLDIIYNINYINLSSSRISGLSKINLITRSLISLFFCVFDFAGFFSAGAGTLTLLGCFLTFCLTVKTRILFL